MKQQTDSVENKPKRWLTRRNVAEALGVSVYTVDAWRREGAPCVSVEAKRGSGARRHIRFLMNELEAWLKARSEAHA